MGDRTIVREFCTLNRGTSELGKSSVGSDCLLMAYVHIAHDCIIGDKTILAIHAFVVLLGEVFRCISFNKYVRNNKIHISILTQNRYYTKGNRN